MSENPRAPEPTELVYVPQPSWAPIFVAAGIALLMVATYKGWAYAMVGAIVLLAAARHWVWGLFDDVDRLPRRQRVTSAVIPAQPLRRPGSDG